MFMLHRVIAVFLLVALAQIPVMVSASDPAPDAIIQSAVSAIDSQYLYARTNTLWDKAKRHLLGTTYKTSADVYQALVHELAAVEDSELNVLTKRQLAELQRDVAGKRVGIGLVDYSIDRDPSGEARIVTPIFGTPSAEAGAEAGDIIERVNGRPTRAMTHEEVIAELRRKSAGGEMALSLRRGQRRFQLMIHATDAEVVPVHVEIVKSGSAVIGYIRIVQFTPESGLQVRRAVSKFESDSVDAYILDVRNNPGGQLVAAVAAASAFTHGPYGLAVNVTGNAQPLEGTEPVLTQKPVVVLINKGTASAAEVLTGALRDNAKATVVGATSYGRGQGQTYSPLTQDFGITLPVVLLQTPIGTRLTGSGLKPEIEVTQSPPTLRTVATQEDASFARAIEILGPHSRTTGI
jgi:carboxyl-terminal processing protease